jgi:hypothetical protein
VTTRQDIPDGARVRASSQMGYYDLPKGALGTVVKYYPNFPYPYRVHFDTQPHNELFGLLCTREELEVV